MSIDAGQDSLYGAPEIYDAMFGSREHDITAYLECVGEPGTEVLELGVGTGRLALPLCRAGHHVTGVERASGMIAKLRRELAQQPPPARQRLTLIQADARQLALTTRFARVLMPFNAYAHLHTSQDSSRLLACVTRHLAAGGEFWFDLARFDPQLLAGSQIEIPWFRHPVDGRVHRATQRTRFDATSSLLIIETSLRAMEGPDDRVVLSLCLKVRKPAELHTELASAGLRVFAERDLGDAALYGCVAAD